MKRVFIFTILGILSISMGCVDLSRGVFLLPEAPAREIYNVLFVISLIGLCVASTFMLPLKKRLLFFILLSIYFVFDHAIWFSMGQALGGQEIPIRESMPYFEKGYQYYMKWIYDERIEFHTDIFLMFYMFLVFTMGTTLWIRKVVKAFIDHNKK